MLHSSSPLCGTGMGCRLRTLFSRFVVQAFGLQAVPMRNVVTLVARRYYLAHPRSAPIGLVSRAFSNEVRSNADLVDGVFGI